MAAFIAIDSDGTVDAGLNPLGVLRGYIRGFLYDPRSMVRARPHAARVGPRIPLVIVRRLADVHRVMVIGNSWLQAFGFDGIRVGDLPVAGLAYGKSRALREWREQFPRYDRYIVVDDLPSQYEEGFVGWEHYFPGEFLRSKVGELLG